MKRIESFDMNYTALGARMRVLRKRQNMTQGELAGAVGISLSFVGHIERGSRVLSVESLVRIAFVLGTSPNELLSESLGCAPAGENAIDAARRLLDAVETSFHQHGLTIPLLAEPIAVAGSILGDKEAAL